MNRPFCADDLELFRQQMADATPLTPSPAMVPERPKPAPYPRPPDLSPPADAPALSHQLAAVTTHDYLLFARPGIQHRVVAELQRGAIEVELEVDLHGLYAEHARQLIAEFLAECARRHIRCARIIHGKGYRSAGAQPVLKQGINHWLRQSEQVLAFCSATRRDGGTGAVYVLLRNPDKQRPRSRR
ncbi:Smr/MutS family protein [Chromatium okenii]|uniref:Smr/MutS family protein n=1 Tax=Chromatium okenii TaxID=61644 RepID=UPI001903A6F1|nr:Smr/MutS family protein [Chromatium okenii]